MKFKRPMVLVLAAAAFFVAGAVAVPASAAIAPAPASGFRFVTGSVTPLQGNDGSVTYQYANQSTILAYNNRVLWVSTAALHCDSAGPTNCQADQPPSMWTDAVRGLDPQAPAAIARGGIDGLNYDDRGGAGAAKPRLIDMYRRALRSALAKAGI